MIRRIRSVTPRARSTDRRDDIVAAAYRCIAQDGYERTSTAQICSAAGVSSGTFFHHFPTKISVLVAILQRDLERIRQLMNDIARHATRDADGALALWTEYVIADASDSDLPGFVAALATVPDHHDVTSALNAETELVHDTLVRIVSEGQRQKTMRVDRTAASSALWLRILSDGVLHHVVEHRPSTVTEHRHELLDAARRLVQP
ncbi:TetR/AcrR family transcriptional regulator [Rhodococcus sp. BP-252]|nr:TetR/AcrR family transcriptional regulator [Rhodococcus sp. B10]MBY6411992.1 TetR/AcrR family transcriptional regulator [Rhodococcus sp. BP-320]MBY6416380.1 TetR/AcrR family transcriptional regulator [Rhodococcus sp. BP-321]MBY6420814.1 TetR/AcrR family transcriptional regulator [Rhodococcus sp. BP-324]MBY6426404.1 TetR/AcrR family transcriptional regulator [Rhodococcus sp. BP-323]MBY6431403.1 TetR/AcrR family transcriptional regulator [Rhodococcus sp. BP-322]MBY6439782.1 TetR/AcrR family 